MVGLFSLSTAAKLRRHRFDIPATADHDLGLSFLRALSITRITSARSLDKQLQHATASFMEALHWEAVPKFQQNLNPQNILRH